MAKKIEIIEIVNSCYECPFCKYDAYYDCSNDAGYDCVYPKKTFRIIDESVLERKLKKINNEAFNFDLIASVMGISNKCPLKDA